MMLTDKFEAERLKIQALLDTLLCEGAECLVKDGAVRVTAFYLDSFELLLPQPFFDRLTGELTDLSWWCWFREIHFEGGMQRSHLLHVKSFEWLNDRNLRLQTDDYTLLISALDPEEVDTFGAAVWAEWLAFKQVNPWLAEVAEEIKADFMETVKGALG